VSGTWPGDKTRALTLKLTAPQVVPITSKQHRHAVQLLSAMIVSWIQRDRDATVDRHKQQPQNSRHTASPFR
jgi:hypothetical protein